MPTVTPKDQNSKTKKTMITRFTITGADNSIRPIELLKLSLQFPFVEWGILVSRKQFGNARFPSLVWLHELEQLKRDSVSGQALNLSCHLCGAIVRELLMGNFKWLQQIESVWPMFERVQINTHGEAHSFDYTSVHEFININTGKEFIFQYDNTPTANDLLKNLMLSLNKGVASRVQTLFDLSHGAGVLPKEWPSLIDGIPCGYAGGLSPDNLEDQIRLIEQKAAGQEIWIDMETHVRSNQDQQFDLDKVKRCLEICEAYV